jgi:diaminopimelate dehydrogenase
MSRAPRPPWSGLRLAVIGLGRLGTACARAVLASPGLQLAALVRRPASIGYAPSAGLPAGTPVCELGALRDVDAALVCVPPEAVLDTARQLLSRDVPIVECAKLHALAFREHHEAIHREALRQRRAAVVGAGWDPGALPVLRGWLALLVPKGRTEVRMHASASLHHTLAARDVAGVRDALCAERRGDDGRARRYVYVELEPGADAEQAAARIRSDPLFLGEPTEVLPVDSLAALEEEGEGVVLERWGAAGATGHQRLLLEARCDPTALAAQVMLGAARALPFLPPGAHGLDDVPAARLFGAASPAAHDARP